MSQSPVYFFCDGPACLVSVDDAGDEDDLVTTGWLLVTFAGEDEDERVSHFHSYACLVAWAAEGAAEEAA